MLADAGIMTGSNLRASVLPRCIEQSAPLDMTVAQHTGVRRTPVRILVNEVLNDMLAEGIAKIHNVMLKTHPLSVMLSLHDALYRAAAFLFRQTGLLDAVECTERNPHQVIALLFQEQGTNRRVYTSRHSYQHTFLHLGDSKKFISACKVTKKI